LAMPGMIHPSELDSAVLQRDYPVMIGLLIMLYLFARMGKRGHIGRIAGSIMLISYISYNGFLAYQSTTGLSI